MSMYWRMRVLQEGNGQMRTFHGVHVCVFSFVTLQLRQCGNPVGTCGTKGHFMVRVSAMQIVHQRQHKHADEALLQTLQCYRHDTTLHHIVYSSIATVFSFFA